MDPGPHDRIDEDEVIDMEEKTPDLDQIYEDISDYKNVLRDIDRLQFAYIQADGSDDIIEELDSLYNQASNLSSRIGMGIEEMDATDFLVGSSDPEECRDKLETFYSPELDFIEKLYNTMEDYHEELRERKQEEEIW